MSLADKRQQNADNAIDNIYATFSFNTDPALMEKLTGRSEFKGKNPIDPFCDMWDTRL